MKYWKSITDQRKVMGQGPVSPIISGILRAGRMSQDCRIESKARMLPPEAGVRASKVFSTKCMDFDI